LPAATVLAALLVEQVQRRQPLLRGALVAPFLLWIVMGVVVTVGLPRMNYPAAKNFGPLGMPVFAEGTPVDALCAYLASSRPRLSVEVDLLGAEVVESLRIINERTPLDSRVFLLYEARIGCFMRPVEVGSVFDRSPLLEYAVGTQSGEELRERLRKAGFHFLYVNEYELRRIIGAYGPRAAYQERRDRLGNPEVENLSPWIDLYPPYYQDPRFPESRRVIEEFVEICRRQAIYSANPRSPHGLWIAPLQ
jgi:hypothetical protein